MEIACRLSCYGPFQAEALGHLAGLGVRAVEMHAPSAGELDSLCRRLDAHNLHVVTVQVALDIERRDAAEQLAPQLAIITRLGARQLLIAPRPGLRPNPEITAQLHRAAANSAAAGVVALLEMHPHLAASADEALATLARVAHPNLKINFDTANVAYYNRGGDPLVDLARLGPRIGGVHLKDGSGRFEQRWFPALGEGTIDFPRIFDALDEAGFDGVCTIEIEPPRDGSATQASVESAVGASVAYLRRIGRFPG
jgi:sugar phosphate isomerase/epimerase